MQGRSASSPSARQHSTAIFENIPHGMAVEEETGISSSLGPLCLPELQMPSLQLVCDSLAPSVQYFWLTPAPKAFLSIQ